MKGNVAFDVRVDGVSKRFEETQALDHVSLHVASGSFFSLLGPSGCGKSTLLRLISGFEAPDSGAIFIGSEDMTRTPPNRRPTSLVFQRWALFPHLNVRENIEFGLKLMPQSRNEVTSKVEEMLQLVGLEGLGQRKPSQLSGGQQQRVALARSLAIRPAVLLLDEPLASLDLKLRMQMQLELKRIQREVRTTFIFVTHDQGEAMTMSDAIAVMRNGRVEQVGSPQHIYDHPMSTFVAGFIGDTNLLTVRPAPGEPENLLLSGRPIIRPVDGLANPQQAHTLSLRQERVLVGEELSCRNQLPAQVVEVIFSGKTVRYRLQLLGGGEYITAEVPHRGFDSIYCVGRNLHVGWDPNSAVLLAS
jgi:ABC-type Fe3+/spermidine/putrescine transport system ATPase subunit